MKRIGNVRANAHWEGNIPTGWQKVRPDSSDEAVEAWIRKKYEHRLFVNASKDQASVYVQGAIPIVGIGQERSPIPPSSARKGSEIGDVGSQTTVDDSFALAPKYKSRAVDLNIPSLSSELPKIRTNHMVSADEHKIDPFADLEEQFGEFQSAHKSCT
ncbi:hypothetical protein KFL_000480240 [Klebsormidium nitens]|uniref:Uncharacterized protein n=1 Tax=Klebsormidium nitens TaxID=105231 RepID=A0A1Y1HQ27_KLENI|nr:hypothetical protein KFL_000480240 [Klebsormidium nitens]|eukprot:GAQ80183.1 hypothetical protein KFL_000480240 [Klebsormidium nitens]